MKTQKPTLCIICKKPVSQKRSTSGERLTCKRKKVKDVWVKSECELEKNRRYQKRYRESHKSDSPPKKKTHPMSVATCSLKHLAKYEATKYKRWCLKCGKRFTGVGKFNRVCDNCTMLNSRIKS